MPLQLSTIAHHIRTLTRESWEQRTASARRRLKRTRVWGPSRQALEAVIHKTLRQGCALGSAHPQQRFSGTASGGHVQAQSNGSRSSSCRGERMEHVIMGREDVPWSRCVRVVVEVRWSIGRMRSSGALGGGVEVAHGCSWMTSVPLLSLRYLFAIHHHLRPRVERRLVDELFRDLAVMVREVLVLRYAKTSVQCHLMITW